MSLDLGALVGRVVLETTAFDRTYTRVVRQFSELGTSAERSAAGTATLDESLAAVGASASTTSTAITRTTRTVAASAATEEKAATAARQHAAAVAEVATIMSRVTTDAQRMQQAELRLLSAQERLNAVNESGTATTRQLAAAHSALIGAQRTLQRTQMQSAGQASTLIGATEDQVAATERLAAVMAPLAGATSRERQAALQLAAAQERLNILQADGTVSTAALASAEASLIGAQRALAASQEATAVSSSRMRGALAGTARTAGELGLVIGGIEIAKKTIEFVGAGKDLTDALNSVQAASHATDRQMSAVRAQSLALGRDLRVPSATAVDAADAINDLVRAGMTLPRAMAAARPALLLAAAAQVDTADAARFLGDTLDDFGLSGDKAAHVANVLAGGATSAGGGLTEMFQALKYAGPVARAAGTDVDTLVTSITMLAKGGIMGDQAGTGLRAMLLALAGPTKQQAQGFRELGITTHDAAGNLLPLPKLMDALHQAQERMNPAEFLAAIKHAFGKPATSVVAAFAHQGIEGYNRFAERIKSGNVQRYADLMNRGVAASFRQFEKEATAAGIATYQKFEPSIAATVAWIAVNLPAAVHTAAGVLGPFAHIVGDVLGGAFHFLGSAVSVAITVLRPVFDLLHVLATPAAAVATGVLAMWASFRLLTAVPEIIRTLIAVTKGAALTVIDLGTAARATSIGFVASARGMGTAATASAAQIDRAGAAAATGWAAALGPMAALFIGVYALTSAFGEQTHATEDAKKAQQSYADALENTTDLLSTAALHATEKNLQDAKAVDLVSKLGTASHGLGLSLAQMSVAVNGNQSDFDRLYRSLLSVADAQTQVSLGGKTTAQLIDDKKIGEAGSSYHLLRSTYNDTGQAAVLLALKLRDLRGALTAQQKAALQLQHAQRAVQEVLDGGKSAAAAHARALNLTSTAYLDAQAAAKQSTQQTQAQTAAFQAENDAASLLQQALDGLAGINLGVAQAQTTLRAANNDAVKSFKTNGAAIKGATTAAIANQRAIQSQVQAGQAYATAVGKRTKSTTAEVAALKSSKQQLEDQLAAHHKLTPAVLAYIEKLYNLRAVSDYLTAHPTKAGLRDEATAKLAAIQAKMDSLRQRETPVLNVDTYAAAVKVANLQAEMDRLTGNSPGGGATTGTSMSLTPPGRAAGGGLPVGWAAVGEKGAELTYTSGGKTHVFSHNQSRAIVAATGMHAPGFAGGTTPAMHTSTSSGSKTGNIVDTATLPGVSGIAELIHGQTGPAATAMRMLSQAVNDAFKLKGIESELGKVQGRIKSMTSYKSGITQTLSGSFDATKYGSVLDLVGGIHGATATNKAYTGEVDKLRAEAKGNKTMTKFINQLAASGQTATLDTLAHASKGQFKQVSAAEGAYNKQLNLAGNAAVYAKYGTTISAQQARADQLTAERKAEVASIDKLVAAIGKLTNRPVEVKIGGEVVAKAVVKSNVFTGVLDELSHTLHYGRNHH